LSVLYNYFDNPVKLFSNLYLSKLLEASAKPFFPCTDYRTHLYGLIILQSNNEFGWMHSVRTSAH